MSNNDDVADWDVRLRTLREFDARFRHPLMSYFVRRVSHHADAEDLTQQVFMRLAATDDVAGIDHAPSFIFTIAANLLRDRVRRRKASIATVPLPDRDVLEQIIGEAMEDRSPERVILARETLSDVLGSLDELGGRTREIFILFRLGNMKQHEIAKLFGIGLSTVEKHVIRATLHLARRYADQAP